MSQQKNAEDLRLEIDRLREKLRIAVEALEAVELGGRPFFLGEQEFDDQYSLATEALKQIREEI